MFDTAMRYIAVSKRFLVDYDLGDREIVGLTYYEVFPEIPEHWKEIHRHCLAGAVEKAGEGPFLRANGKMDWVRWEIHP
jgi:two-component system, chemotaxis family, CheB/CheR fusion protein